MTRWRISGYAEPALFPGANACRFRICHHRDDGLVLFTFGDQRERGGRLAPVFQGFHFMTVVGRLTEGAAPEILDREPCQTAAAAEERHALLLREWEDRQA